MHQPWGNFDYVFADHLRDVYRPLIRSLMAGELWPVALHLSGPLLEWLELNAPAFLDEVGEHAAAGRIELLCAGHDEPILAVLSREDRFEQVLRSRDWIGRRFGVDAPGLWLTERVWEPTLPGELAAAGVRFALVDDRHFRVTGFENEQLHAHYVTESGGASIRLFPIDEKLRYLIPFRPPAELAEYFRQLRDAGHRLAVLGDDGEKFGGWPGTLQWLYQDGWLEAFLGTMRALRDRGEVTMSRFDAALVETPSAGLAYLPSASYREMEGWSLPYEPARALLRLERAWAGDRIQGVDGGLLRGGHWRHFLVKYPESNRMHKYAMKLSEACRSQGDPALARRAIGRAQCNDAYWHGVFGGLYLPFLRDAIWTNLAVAEAILRQGESLQLESCDIDADSHDEIWIHSAQFSVLAAPVRGGQIELWLDLVRHENLLNVIARHREAYHQPLDATTERGHHDHGGAASIHDLDTPLSEIPPADADQRALFVDRVVAPSASRDDFVAGRDVAVRSWARQAMDSSARIEAGTAVLEFAAAGLGKTVRIHSAIPTVIECEWTWNSADYPPESWFTTELSLSGPVLIDAPGSDRWEYTIETVAKSERGFDRSAQGTAVVLRWPVAAGAAHAILERS